MNGFGFGGLGASFPMRYGGAPISQQVLSSEEVVKPIWDEYDQKVRQAQSSTNDFWNKNQSLLDSRYANSSLDPAARAMMTSRLQRLASAELGGGNLAGAQFAFGHTGNADALANELAQASSMPDYQAYKTRADAALQPYLQNQTVQQQAYDSMRRAGEQNAVLPPGYATPGYGQVTGQSTNPFAPNPQGADMSWSSGIYSPGANAQTGVYNPLGTTAKPWGL